MKKEIEKITKFLNDRIDHFVKLRNEANERGQQKDDMRNYYDYYQGHIEGLRITLNEVKKIEKSFTDTRPIPGLGKNEID